MALAMRLSRAGRKSRPFYRIVVADKRMARDGRYIEKLGTYNPMLANDDEKRVVFNEERVKYWLSEGAEPSTRVQIFLGKAGLMDMPEIREKPKKSAQSEKTKMKLADKEEKLKAKVEADAKAAEEAKAEAAAAETAAAESAKAESAEEQQPAEAPEEVPAETPDEAPAEQPDEAKAEEKAETGEEKKEG